MKTNFSVKDTLSVLTTIAPFAFSMAVCSGFGAFTGAVFACVATLICDITEKKQQMPIYVSLLIITYTFKEFGISTASLSIVICGVLLVISSLFYEKAKHKLELLSDISVAGSLMLSCALTVTVLFTTDYFGIGATGNTAKEMDGKISRGSH